ncbi:GerMN domain-containing protein [Paenibacillus sp. sptzw28]|uniref:GerMN domain-containing protein n=1 Tax=Paenibacillus sp. sptzw28 TaxID=715179 RepID=UPI001C6E3CE9|nr:GerMN domain-containing protein [Paenibacillus sp. sptzw28]QYR23726.1 GerMN domain-containing protein [Paenibacillus sp. sptzw28]
MKHQATIRLLLVMLAVSIVFTVSACGAQTEMKQGSGSTDKQPATAVTGEQQTTTAPAVKTEQINVYYSDKELTGLHEQKAQIQYNNTKQKAEEAFKQLQKDGVNGTMSLWKNVQLLSVKEEGGAVTFDIHIPENARFGAPGEEYALESIQKTMFQFDDIKSIDLLVDGEKADSLMGHESLDHPIMRQ